MTLEKKLVEIEESVNYILKLVIIMNIFSHTCEVFTRTCLKLYLTTEQNGYNSFILPLPTKAPFYTLFP